MHSQSGRISQEKWIKNTVYGQKRGEESVLPLREPKHVPSSSRAGYPCTTLRRICSRAMSTA
jgi:hypothetical protein